MPYIVKLPGGWLNRGKVTTDEALATVYPHPSSAKRAAFGHDGAQLVSLQTKPRGRPPIAGGASAVNITLYSEHIAKAKRIGGGKISQGVRKALDDYIEGESK